MTPPTATVDGYIEYICPDCGHTYTEAVIPTDFIVESNDKSTVGYTGEANESLIIPDIIQEKLTYEDNWYRVTAIGEWAFYYCYNLVSITLPDTVTSIEDRAFSDCTNLTSITIPNSVTHIGSDVFSWDDALTSITFEGTVAQWKAIHKHADWDWESNITTIICTDGVVTLS